MTDSHFQTPQWSIGIKKEHHWARLNSLEAENPDLSVSIYVEDIEGEMSISLIQHYFFPKEVTDIKAQFDDSVQHYTIYFKQEGLTKVAYIKEVHTFFQSLEHHQNLILDLLSAMIIATTLSTKMIPFPRKAHFKLPKLTLVDGG